MADEIKERGLLMTDEELAEKLREKASDSLLCEAIARILIRTGTLLDYVNEEDIKEEEPSAWKIPYIQHSAVKEPVSKEILVLAQSYEEAKERIEKEFKEVETLNSWVTFPEKNDIP